MRKNKIQVNEYINDKNARIVSYSKRKKNLIKKAIELSKMCGQEIFIMIFDKERQKIVEYRNHNDFDINIVSSLMIPDIRLQFTHNLYTNDD